MKVLTPNQEEIEIAGKKFIIKEGSAEEFHKFLDLQYRNALKGLEKVKEYRDQLNIPEKDKETNAEEMMDKLMEFTGKVQKDVLEQDKELMRFLLGDITDEWIGQNLTYSIKKRIIEIAEEVYEVQDRIKKGQILFPTE